MQNGLVADGTGSGLFQESSKKPHGEQHSSVITADNTGCLWFNVWHLEQPLNSCLNCTLFFQSLKTWKVLFFTVQRPNLEAEERTKSADSWNLCSLSVCRPLFHLSISPSLIIPCHLASVKALQKRRKSQRLRNDNWILPFLLSRMKMSLSRESRHATNNNREKL